jgi:NTE family protein
MKHRDAPRATRSDLRPEEHVEGHAHLDACERNTPRRTTTARRVLDGSFKVVAQRIKGGHDMGRQFRNLVFEGGGVRGIAYVGAMQILAERGLMADIDRVGGTSAGAINALILALKYDLNAQRQILDSTEFRDFMDSSFGYVRDFKRLWQEFGWNKGAYFEDWAGSLIKEKLGTKDATFGDLRAQEYPDLHVIGTNLSTGYSEVFSAERHPDMKLVTAIRISMSIPLFYRAKRFGSDGDVYVDGGVMLNYPVKLFDRLKYIDASLDPEAARFVDYYNRENARFRLDRPESSPYVYNRQTLGMRLDKAEEIALFRYGEPQRRTIKTFPSYARALISAVLAVQENQHLHSDDWQRTVYINTLDVGTTDFALDQNKKRALLEQGIKGAEVYFQWFEDPAEEPVNRLPRKAEVAREPALALHDGGF